MPDSTFIELSQMQMQRAKELLTEIPVLIQIGAYNTAANRAYYAAFHAMKALEALDNYDSKKHSGVVSYFRQHYIKTGVFDADLSDLIEVLQTTREESDYNIIVRINAEEAEMLLRSAVRFVDAIAAYLPERYRSDQTFLN